MTTPSGTMETKSVLDRVVRVLARTEDLEVGALRPQTRLEQDLGMDSLSLVELQMALEEEFGVELPDGDVSALRTIGDVAAAVEAARR
jgi:acyl carrier protein